jgi:hypothetical protein
MPILIADRKPRKHPEKLQEWKDYKLRRKLRVIALLGFKCVCCLEREPNCLCIAHWLNEGSLRHSWAYLWKRWTRSGWLDPWIGLLCASCNQSMLIRQTSCCHRPRRRLDVPRRIIRRPASEIERLLLNQVLAMKGPNTKPRSQADAMARTA